MRAHPVLLSIPHGGLEVPEELEGRLAVSDSDVLYDGDSFAAQIYDLGGKARHTIKARVARAFVDVNRSLRRLPPAHPDGLLKSLTCQGKPVYANGSEPDEGLARALIARYYHPYHREIQRSVRELDLQLCLDCHTMLPAAPGMAPDRRGSERPAFCLSNVDGRTCSAEMIELLASCISESYGVGRDRVWLNSPFSGGHITRTYGGNPVPWIQVEMNRSLYMAEPWLDARTLQVGGGRLQELNEMFGDALDAFFARSGM